MRRNLAVNCPMRQNLRIHSVEEELVEVVIVHQLLPREGVDRRWKHANDAKARARAPVIPNVGSTDIDATPTWGLYGRSP